MDAGRGFLGHMSKWIIATACVALLGWFAWFQIHAVKISYVNGLDRYAHLPNQEYILEQDCYVFAWREHIDTAYPLLGVNAPGVRVSVPALPREVTRANLGKDFPAVRLMDIIPKGTRFLVVSVRREEKRGHPTLISYEIKLLDQVDRPFLRVDIRPLLLPVAVPGDPPKIDETVAVPWIKR
jgi:hypothetical protein